MNKKTLAILIGVITLTSQTVGATNIKLPRLTTNPDQAEQSQDGVPTVFKMSQAQKSEFERKQWNLSQEEWDKYMLIRNTVNPISVMLAIEKVPPARVLYELAETDEERIKYSIQVMEFEKKHNLSESEMLDINLLTAERVVGVDKKPRFAPSLFNEFGAVQLPSMPIEMLSRSLLFYKAGGCNDECVANVKDSVANAAKTQRVEVYISKDGESVSDKDVNDFIQKYGVTKSQIANGQYVFHFDKGEADAVGVTHYPTLVMKNYAGVLSASRL